MRDPSLLATKDSERCKETYMPGIGRAYRCRLIEGHETAHYFRYTAGAYRMTYERVSGKGKSPLADTEFKDAQCPYCNGTGRIMVPVEEPEGPAEPSNTADDPPGKGGEARDG